MLFIGLCVSLQQASCPEQQHFRLVITSRVTEFDLAHSFLSELQLSPRSSQLLNRQAAMFSSSLLFTLRFTSRLFALFFPQHPLFVYSPFLSFLSYPCLFFLHFFTFLYFFFYLPHLSYFHCLSFFLFLVSFSLLSSPLLPSLLLSYPVSSCFSSCHPN